MVSLLGAHLALSDTLVFESGRTVTGTVLQTNDVNVLMLTDAGALNYARVIISEIKLDRAEELDPQGTNRIPNYRTALLCLSRQPWANDLKQIPATVIDRGILRNVPYVSYRCGELYEVNIYGDLDHPAGIEAGVYRRLTDDNTAKSNCIDFISSTLRRSNDKDIVRALDRLKDLKNRDGLTFEITPPSAPDAYLGWWVSVYSEQELDHARASTEEMNLISVAKAEVSKGPNATQGPAAWSSEDLRFARSTPGATGSAQPAVAVPSYAPPSGSGSGRVYVRGYTRQDGTYVQPYTRNYPHSRN
jgi:hypothetical protein